MKSLRKKRNLTQEQLAEILGVSFQSISKWETNAALPDTMMFPVIANFYGVTTDELFGTNVMRKNAEIEGLCGEIDYMLKEHEYSEALTILRTAISYNPEYDELQYRLALALKGSGKENPKYLDEATRVYMKILDTSVNMELRSKVIRDLAYCYTSKNDVTTALTFVNQLVSFDVCLEYTMGHFNLLEGEALADCLKNNTTLFGNALLECFEYMRDSDNITEEQLLPETKESINQKIDFIKKLLN